MTNEPATLPDEAEKVLLWMEAGEMSLWGEKQANSQTLRAHIAALEAKNRMLLEVINRRGKSVFPEFVVIREKISALEAENKRLRDGLNTSVYRLKDMLKSDDGQAFKEAEKALPRLEVLLAQPDPQKCVTCLGNGGFYEGVKLIRGCPDCNGTGKAGA